MIERLAKLSKSNSFFILGPRGSGKSTLIKNKYLGKHSLYIDLLKPQIEDRYRMHPQFIAEQAKARPTLKWIIIDEVQKIPKLLDVVHHLIETTKIKFILSGSSARKLKRGGANLLAGRAFVFHLYPFSCIELNKKFNLQNMLQWGSLPKLLNFKKDQDKKEYLTAYSLTYLKEEVQLEQMVRKISPFRKFLEIAAQMNGKIINYSKIAFDVGVDSTTVQNYYSILEDTLLGFSLMPYHISVRKSQRQSPKFYLFDTGICRTLNRTLNIPLTPQTYAYGEAFEHFIILEFMKLSEYFRKDWKFSYILTKDRVEIDLIVDRPGKKTLCIEIKSSSFITKGDVRNLNRLGPDIPNSLLYCLSRDPHEKKIQNVHCMEWQTGLKKIFKIK